MRRARAKLAIAAIIGLPAAVAGCAPGHSGAAAGSPSTTRTTPAVPATSPVRPAVPASAPGTAPRPATASARPAPPPAPATSPPPAAGPRPVPAVTHPGVIADCTRAPPHRLSIRPATIVLACADDGLGVQKLAWTTWGASTATGQGTFWEHVCAPSCAASDTSAYYPVALTLSRVKTSAPGQWFSRLRLTWLGKRPPVMPDAFPLDAPDS